MLLGCFTFDIFSRPAARRAGQNISSTPQPNALYSQLTGLPRIYIADSVGAPQQILLHRTKIFK